jgi:hypothetical protein
MVKTKIIRARSSEEYVSLIEQALDDTWDLRQSIEYDEEYMADARGFIDELEAGLKEIHESMKDGSYKFATGDFSFMAILGRYHEALIPFKFLLIRINETHMKGLEIES